MILPMPLFHLPPGDELNALTQILSLHSSVDPLLVLVSPPLQLDTCVCVFVRTIWV